MKHSDILAVVVSYNGLEKTCDTVRALHGKVGHILIVDNGSAESSIGLLRDLVCADVSLVPLSENRGIGYALNAGVEAAIKSGLPWLLTMDQDSIVEPDLIEKYCEAINERPEIVCLTPSISMNGADGEERIGLVKYAITSGNLVKVEVFDKIGLYNEEMFIDGVDFDFCLRLRGAGWNIYRVNALMKHELGERYEVPTILGRFYTRHSPVRRYYMYRNYLYLAQKYCFRFPLFTLKMTITHLVLLALIPFFDKEPAVSLSCILRGAKDFFSGRTGRYTEGQ